MDGKRACICCPNAAGFGNSPKRRKIPHPFALGRDGCLEDILQALQTDFEPIVDPCDPKQRRAMKRPLKIKRKKAKKQKSRIWPPKPPRGPKLNPPMDLRLRYIGHCSKEPESTCQPMKSALLSQTNSEFDVRSCKNRKCHGSADPWDTCPRFPTSSPCDVVLAKPSKSVTHALPNKDIIQLPSPKTSGTNVQVKKALLKPSDRKPPIPPKSAHDLFPPHSGILINADKSFVPDGMALGGGPKPQPLKREAMPQDICTNKKCKNKKCRRRAAKIRKMRLAARKRALEGEYEGQLPIASDVTTGKGKARRGRRASSDPYEDPCGLDDIPEQEHVKIPAGLKKHAFKTHSLTVLRCAKEEPRGPPIKYGILMGTHNMYADKFGGKSRGKQALTMSVMAYCLAFHYHPKQWTMKLVDDLLVAGDQWYQQLIDKVHDHGAFQGMCEVMPFGKKQVLLLNHKRMQVLLCEPDIVGYTMSKDPTIYNLCKGLTTFFQDNRAGVLLTRVLKLIIWKDKICFYIFDPAGRNAKAYSNYSVGTAALINVKDTEAVASILLARSSLEDQRFVLAAVKVLRMVPEEHDDDLEEEKELTHAEKAMMSYRILDENCAIVNANLHLGDRMFDEAKWRQALPIAVAALTYAKISPPNTWYTKTLDKIIRFGNKLYIECANPKVIVDLTIDNIPNAICIGPYVCEIIIYRDRVKGQLFTTKECLYNIRTGLEEFFSKEYSSGLLEFHGHCVAVWKQKDMFYMFDPYPRTNDGERALKQGKGCCFMFLNTDTMAEAFITIWEYMPISTPFFIHAFKVLKLKKKSLKTNIKCTLSDAELPGAKGRRKVLKASQARGDGDVFVMTVTESRSTTGVKSKTSVKVGKTSAVQKDEEQMGDIVSLVESIQEDYLPPVPRKYKNLPPEPEEVKIANLDSPTVSVTQVIPPWPKPRDKTNEPPEPDPEYEPTPPPTPPPPPPPEGAEEEELGEEEMDEERLAELARKKAEEEEARRRAEALPPPLPPPPPTPQYEDEIPLAQSLRQGVMGGGGGSRAGGGGSRGGGGGRMGGAEGAGGAELELEADMDDEMETMAPVKVERKVLLSEDAKRNYKLRKTMQRITPPLIEDSGPVVSHPSEELLKPHNFMTLLDNTQIIRGSRVVPHAESMNVLPFTAIMAVITSYQYQIDTWAPSIVDFIIDAGNKVYKAKKEKFQLAPIHIIPKIGIGNSQFHANIDVVGEGATWQLEPVLKEKFFQRYDRGVITMTVYSCAIFCRNGLYYLYDGSMCNGMGLRDNKDKAAKACFMRFRSLHDLCARVCYNKDGNRDDQQFILSRVLVRRLVSEERQQLPEDYDFIAGKPAPDSKSKMTYVKSDKKGKSQSITELEPPSLHSVDYQLIEGMLRIEGTTAVDKTRTNRCNDIGPDHFVCLIAMLMATMHPIRTWYPMRIDVCIEKGMEIFQKTKRVAPCEKRVIKNLILEGKFIDITIKKITVVNENPQRCLEQYMNAVLGRLRYVIIRFPTCSMVVCCVDGAYHLFDPFPTPPEKELLKIEEPKSKPTTPEEKKSQQDLKEQEKQQKKMYEEWKKSQPKMQPVASWTRYSDMESLILRIRYTVPEPLVENPDFYTFELTSIKSAAPRKAIDYRLSPNFALEENPNTPYLAKRPPRPLVDEKMYWLHIERVPWSRLNPCNDLGFQRRTPQAMWKDWDIEFAGDLCSLWGTIHPMDSQFDKANRGKQYLATCVVALVMSKACHISAWTSRFLDGIVIAGDKYHASTCKKFGNETNIELQVEDLDTSFDDMYPYTFKVTFDKLIFGFVYSMEADRFNLSKAISYFFEKHTHGLLVCPIKNFAFGKVEDAIKPYSVSYFMYDCQTRGLPIYTPGCGASYMLKCESINRLIYCMTITLNIRKHGIPFHLYSVSPTIALAANDKARRSSSKGSIKSDKSQSSKGSKGSDKSKSSKGSKGSDKSKSSKGSKGSDKSKSSKTSKSSDKVSSKPSKDSKASKEKSPKGSKKGSPDGSTTSKTSKKSK